MRRVDPRTERKAPKLAQDASESVTASNHSGKCRAVVTAALIAADPSCPQQGGSENDAERSCPRGRSIVTFLYVINVCLGPDESEPVNIR